MMVMRHSEFKRDLWQVIERFDIIVCQPQQGADEVAFGRVLRSRLEINHQSIVQYILRQVMYN